MQTYPVTVHCVACLRKQVIYVNAIDYLDWQFGKHVQDAFPYLTADERESLISNMCVTCIEEMYVGSEEEDEDEYPDWEDLLFPESDDAQFDRDWYVD